MVAAVVGNNVRVDAEYLNVLDSNGRRIRRRNPRPGGMEALIPASMARQIKGSYDLARDGNPAFEEHWKLADLLSPNAANSWSIRQVLRSRSRMEIVGNNPNLHGTVKTLAADTIKRGPRLRISDRAINPKKADDIETAYHRWAKKSKYRQLLRRLCMAKVIDGEGFKIAIENRDWKLNEGDVTLTFQIIEADCVTTNSILNYQPKPESKAIDGIEYDGNVPKRYYVLWEHPGSGNPIMLNPENQGRWIQAPYVTHWFNEDRPWGRGIPEFAASLSLAALSRRYTLATVKAAEIAAEYSAVLETDGPPTAYADPDLEDDPFDAIPAQHGMFVTMPWGYKLKQLSPTNPTTMFDVFVNSLLQASARPIGVPKNVAAGYSGDASMSSAVVDQHLYISTVEEIRRHCEDEVLENDLWLWWREAYTLGIVSSREVPDHNWGWDQVGLKHTDPQKVAMARDTDLKNGVRTMKDIQEEDMNRGIEDYRRDMEDDAKWRKKVKLPLDPAGDAAMKKAEQTQEKGPEKDGKKQRYEAKAKQSKPRRRKPIPA